MEHGQTTTWIGKDNVMETKTFEKIKLLAIVQCHFKFSFKWN
jgi:hypothetical protein